MGSTHARTEVIPEQLCMWNEKWLFVCTFCALIQENTFIGWRPPRFLIHWWAWNTCSRIEVYTYAVWISIYMPIVFVTRTFSFFLNIDVKTVQETLWLKNSGFLEVSWFSLGSFRYFKQFCNLIEVGSLSSWSCLVFLIALYSWPGLESCSHHARWDGSCSYNLFKVCFSQACLFSLMIREKPHM